jgi:hypothetical protein
MKSNVHAASKAYVCIIYYSVHPASSKKVEPTQTPASCSLHDALNMPLGRTISRILASDALHYAIIPVIIIVGMNTSPKPSLLQLLTPI